MPATTLLASARVGVDSLRVNPLRTVLSTLGVIIGVAALVAVLSVGDGMERFMRGEIERTTSVQTVIVASRTTERVDGLTFPVRDYPVFGIGDAREAAAEIDGVAAFTLTASGRAVAEATTAARARAISVTGNLASAADFFELRFAAGRYFTDAEVKHGAPVVVLSHLLAEALSGGRGAEAMLGREVRIQGHPREVVGVIEAYKGEHSYDAAVPLPALPGLVASSGPILPSLLLKAARVEEVEPLRARVEDWLATRFRDWERRVEVTTSQGRLEQAAQGLLLFKLFMGAITGISLIVGGIGIMNVLLASVTERTREIGIRKAIGARRGDVLTQFLAESVAISGAGSAIGAAIGVAAAFAITAVMRAQAAAGALYAGFSWSTLLLVALAAVAVGLAFGVYPALRASRLSPIDAIRHE